MLLITGATGQVGSAILARREQLAEPLRILVRNPDRLPSGITGVDVVVGELGDAAVLDRALSGVRAAFLLTKPTPAQPHIDCLFAERARAAGVIRIVKLSAHGAAPDARSAMNRWHAEGEALIATAAPEVTILRPQFFLQNLLRMAPGAIRRSELSLPADDLRIAMIDVEDVASTVVAALASTSPVAGPIELTGPEAIGLEDVAAALSRMVGKRIAYVPVSPEEMAARAMKAGAPEVIARGLADLYADFRSGFVTDQVLRLTGRLPTSLEDFLKRHRADLAG
jgi:uncharacterized protein YbjT (DUF2867 family)